MKFVIFSDRKQIGEQDMEKKEKSALTNRKWIGIWGGVLAVCMAAVIGIVAYVDPFFNITSR